MSVPVPERPDTEDAYLKCVDCGWSYPLVSTAMDERCSNCEGVLVYALGDWARVMPRVLPEESLAEYTARVQKHVGRVMDEVTAGFEYMNAEAPDWITALKALRDAIERKP